MDTSTPAKYTLSALEEATGVSARTIRYYISQGLVPAPPTVGRTASYGDEHVSRLKQIVTLKAQGLSLGDVRVRLGISGGPPMSGFPSEAWMVHQPTDDVAVFVKAEIPTWRRNQIDGALVPFVTAVTRMKKSSEEG